ncbi:hypothetical protein CAP36_12730 [Chitinophagaceae bacterium IBVUCB2]|nr:hypothetical protein CAP36_12730 [Chitinophagaceae bacterium IBVUCB2]
MKIKNIDGLSAQDLQQEADRGGKFVYYVYTISLLVFTFKRTSNVYLIRKGENARTKGNLFTALSLIFGWWGIPFGPKYTVQSVHTNIKGGKDVTDEVMATVAGHLLFRETQGQKVANQ